MILSKNAEEVAKKRYFMEGENWEGCARRVGGVIAQYETESSIWSEKFSEIIFSGDFIPGGRVLRNAGRARGSLFNCYVIPISDSIEAIGTCKRDALILWAEGGGVGINFSPLRPKGTPIKGKGGKSSGLVSFIKATDGDAETIESGGQRRAAAIAIVDVKHPEIEDFIDAKLKDGILPHFNISVSVTEDFLEAVEKDENWELVFEGLKYREVKARDLWNKIIKNMVKSAEPGLINWSKLRKNNSYYFSPVIGTNPCIHGDTLISTTMGTLPIKELTRYKELDVYCMLKDGTLGIKKATDIRRTKTKARIITVNTQKGSIKCTPDHLIFVKNKGWVKAKDLKPKDLLCGLNRSMANEKQVVVGISGYQYREHRLIAEYYYGDLDGKDVHHVDDNPRNNVIQNLQVLPHYLHSRLSNKGHKDWNDRCSNTGKFVKQNVRKKKTKLPFINKNGKDGKAWRVVSVVDNKETAPVFNMEVADVHNFIANGIVVHNCGEVCLGPYEACNLGSLTLPHFLAGTQTNWKKMGECIEIAVRMLDNVIDANRYTLTQIEQNEKAARRIGIGTMGLADFLFAKGIRYGSYKAISEIERVYKFIRDKVYESSVKLATEKGTFPKYDSSAYNKASFIRKLPAPLRMEIKKYGIRNCTLLAQAPTGTISLIPEVTSGIEPLFAKGYKTNDRVGVRYYIHPLYKTLLEEGQEIPDWFVDSYDIKPMEHFEVQVAVQKYTDSSVSKTINMPKETTSAELSDLLLEYVWDLKGVTVYVDGCKGEQPLNRLTKKEALKYLEEASNEQGEEAVQCAKGTCEV